MLAKIYDDDFDNDENSEVENLSTRTRCGRTAGTRQISSYLSK